MTSINMGVNTGLISMQCYSSAVSSSNFQSAVDFFFYLLSKLGNVPEILLELQLE